MTHDVPFVSQFNSIADPDWRWRGCGITALKMVMDFWHSHDEACQTGSADYLLRVGRDMGAYREGIGWTHRGLVEVVKAFGYEGYNVDHAAQGPTPKSAQASWLMVVDELRKGPILASVYHNLDPERGGGHIIVITGFEDGLVSFNDSEEMNPFEGKKFIILEQFLRGFKRRLIVIRPHIQNM